jgi:Flp pilus assembly protein TadD
MAQGHDAEAREMLRSASGGSPERIEMILAEAQMLRDAGRPDEAWQVLESALARHPDNPDLLYDAALFAERRGDTALMEKYLRRVLELKPDHAHALNALGYSFADRNVRLPEARDLVARALALAPEDAFIMDSMGWILFREGKLDEARAVLEKAYGLRDDPEIAAHLGEVLWSLGRKDDATRLLKAAVRKHPDNEVLAAAVKKFAP